jgi:hypothetical protein
MATGKAYIVLGLGGEGEIFACSTVEAARAKEEETDGILWSHTIFGTREVPKGFKVEGDKVWMVSQGMSVDHRARLAKAGVELVSGCEAPY